MFLCPIKLKPFITFSTLNQIFMNEEYQGHDSWAHSIVIVFWVPYTCIIVPDVTRQISICPSP
jgi:hypothetical protein